MFDLWGVISAFLEHREKTFNIKIELNEKIALGRQNVIVK